MKTKFESIIEEYHITDIEMKRFGGRESVERAINLGLFDVPDDKNYFLGMIYSGRGDQEKADSFFSKVTNKDMLSTLIEDF